MTSQLTILDVGHGNCTVILDNGHVIIIDVGPGSSLLEYLTQLKINKIDCLLISHADNDHVGGAIGLLSSKIVEVKAIWLNPDATKDTRVWSDFLFEIEAVKKTREIDVWLSLTAADNKRIPSAALTVEVLGPSVYLAGKGVGNQDQYGRKLTSNSLSAVIRVLKGGQPIALLPGDLDEIGLAHLIDSGTPANAPLLVFPHHGGKSGSQNNIAFVQNLINVVQPQTVVFSIGRGFHKTPSPELVSALRAASPTVRIACTQLSEHCAAELPRVNPTHLTSAFAQGRDARRCCAGSLVLGLDIDPADLAPAASEHTRFVRTSARTALCAPLP